MTPVRRFDACRSPFASHFTPTPTRLTCITGWLAACGLLPDASFDHIKVKYDSQADRRKTYVAT
jgi:hypothetical protein